MSGLKITVQINPKDAVAVRDLLWKLEGEEVKKAMARTINRTTVGVRTDGTRILSEHYALTASSIRESWKIGKASFRDPSGVVSSEGTFIRMKYFGARQTKTGVSVKVLKKNPRAVIKHAFFATLKQNEQVYWRQYHGPRKKTIANRGYYANLPLFYRFPVKALYGPRIQDYLGDPGIIGTLTGMAGDRLTKNMNHEVEYLLGLRAQNGGEEE